MFHWIPYEINFQNLNLNFDFNLFFYRLLKKETFFQFFYRLEIWETIKI